MAIQMAGADGATVLAIDSQHQAGRVSLRPTPVVGWYSVAWTSGLLTGVGLAGVLFSLRNGASVNSIMLRRVGVGWVQTTAFTAAQRLEFQLVVARNFTSGDTGGAAVPLTGNQGKHRTSFPSPATLDIKCATTAALGSTANKTLDSVAIGLQWLWSGAAGTGMAASPNNLFSHDSGDHPLILAPNEGINILNGVAMGAAGVGMLYVSLEFAEVVAY